MSDIRVAVEFLLDKDRETYNCLLSRVPCVGELVVIGDEAHEVNTVMHFADADAAIERVAIIRVR